MGETDESVVKRVQNGEDEAFGILIDRYGEKLKRYAKRFLLFDEENTDLVQDVFVKAYVNIQSFDTDKRFSPWIYRIAHNEFINAIKKRSASALPFFDPDTLFPHPAASETADEEILKDELKRMMEECLSKLPSKYRESLVLYFYEEMGYEDISEVLRIPVSTVGVRIKRGKEKLKNIYQEKHG